MQIIEIAINAYSYDSAIMTDSHTVLTLGFDRPQIKNRN